MRAGKGNKGRTVYIGARARRALARYWLGRTVTANDPLIPLVEHWRPAHNPRLTASADLRLGDRADVADCHPHTFRRTFALSCLRAGMNIYALQRLMGHADLSILRKYLALVETDLQTAHREHGAVDNLLDKKGR